MSIQNLENIEPGTDGAGGQTCAESAGVPDLELIPLHVRNLAALRGLGFSFRQIGRAYGITPQAASIMLTRQRTRIRSLKRQAELGNLSPRAINCLGRLGVKTRETARSMENLEAQLQSQRNCGRKTTREILDWVAGSGAANS